MNTAVSMSNTAIEPSEPGEPATTGPAFVSVPLGDAGADWERARVPASGPRPGRETRRCSALGQPVGAPRSRPRARGRVEYRRGSAAPARPEVLVERARAGYAATAVTSVLTAALVIGFLTLAHLRAPDLDPEPVPAGTSAAIEPAAGVGPR